MLLRSQPLNEKIYKKLELMEKEYDDMQERNIKSQRIGKMFDDFAYGGKKKIDLRTGLDWKRRNLENAFYDFKHIIRNHIKWHKTLCGLRPWEGFDGLFQVMKMHLCDYAAYEEQYGISEENYKNQKISSVKETLEILERMSKPDEYSQRLREQVESKYPKYQELITEYVNGSSCYSGYFIAQGTSWAGIESGNNPREGYFVFINGIFELTTSPDQAETDKLLDEIRTYHQEIEAAYKQAEADSDNDFDKLGQLLKENLYTWWD